MIPYFICTARTGANGVKIGEVRIHGPIGDGVFDEGMTAERFEDELAKLGQLDELHVSINSVGGSVMEGVAIYHAILGHGARTIAKITGWAASIAGLIPMAADQVLIGRASQMMVHDPSTIAAGGVEDMERAIAMLEAAKESMIDGYMRRELQISRDELSDMMSAETWLVAERAIELGFADALLDEGETLDGDLSAQLMVAQAKTLGWRNIPEISTDGEHPMTTKETKDSKATPATPATPATSSTDSKATPATPAAAAAAPMDPKTIGDLVDAKVRDALRQHSHEAEVRALFAPYGEAMASLRDRAVSERMTPTQAKAALFDELGKGEHNRPVWDGASITPGLDSRDKALAGMERYCLALAGIEKRDPQSEYNGRTLLDLARHCLAIGGASTRGGKREVVAAAFTHSNSDFPKLLENIANKSMLEGWESAPETFPVWTTPGTLPDFKQGSRPSLDEVPSLRQVRPGAEYKYQTIGESGENIILGTYGELFSITRAAIINDDQRAFTAVPRKQGAAARATIGDAVYAVLTGNPNMSDGNKLFDAVHNNIGTPGAPSAQTLDELLSLMATQEDSSGRALNIRGGYWVVPMALRSDSRIVVASSSYPDGANPAVINPNQNEVVVVADARLDQDSKTRHFLAARDNAIEVAYLDGVEEPYLEQEEGFTRDGVVMKVRIDFGVAPLSWRTLAKNDGA